MLSVRVQVLLSSIRGSKVVLDYKSKNAYPFSHSLCLALGVRLLGARELFAVSVCSCLQREFLSFKDL